MEVSPIMKRFKFIALFSLFIFLFAGRAEANIFYTAEDSGYTAGSAGVITKSESEYKVQKDVVTNLGGDAAGFTFLDHDGRQRAMVREYNYGAPDPVYVWDPSNWKMPLVNRSDWGFNIHGAASSGKYLYLVTYESYAAGSSEQDTGEIIQIDMSDNSIKNRYKYPAFTGESGAVSSPHGEAVFAYGGYIYAVFGVSYRGVDEYEPTEVVKFDSGLKRVGSVKLRNSAGRVGRNAMRGAIYGGKLYVANIGGYQGPNSWGDIWEVNLSNMSSRQVLDGSDMPHVLDDGTTAAVGMYGIQFTSDGTAFLLAGSYSRGYDFRARIFKTTASALAAGDKGSLIAEYSPVTGSSLNKGYSWDILWDEPSETLWCMTGSALEARSVSGALVRSFTPAELGDNIYSISLLNGSNQTADGGETPDTGSEDENATEATPEDVSDLSDLISVGFKEDWFLQEGGGYALKKSVAMSEAGKVFDDVVDARSLRTFNAVAASVGGMVSVRSDSIEGADLLARSSSEVNLIKVRPAGVPLSFAYDKAGNKDGTFRVLRGGVVYDGALSSSGSYALELFIKDGGEFDLDGKKDGSILDPAVLVRVKRDESGEQNEQQNSGGSGGSGGGCATGAAAFAALAFALLKRSSRKGVSQK
jgi:hypothetical protein